jgi:N-formylglutamate deformylase
VLHIPHSSRVIPHEERKNLVLDDTDLERELLRMTDAFTDELFPPTLFETARVVFPISRLICDVERFIEDAEEPMAARGMGVVYVTTTEGGALRQNLTPKERTRIINCWYTPHHEAITLAVDPWIEPTVRDIFASSSIATASHRDPSLRNRIRIPSAPTSA